MRVVVAAIIGLLAGVAGQAQAQAQAQAVVLRGTVVTESGAPLEGARVQAGLARMVPTDAEGRFHIVTGLAPESTVVTVARIGRQPIDTTLLLVPGENVLEVRMAPLVQTVDSVRVVAVFEGIEGVVVDTAFAPLPGVRVRDLARGIETTTGADGSFRLGKARRVTVLELSKPGLKARMLSVTVPPRRGVQVVAWMRPLDAREALHGGDRTPTWLLQDMVQMGFRRGTARGPWTAITREQIVAASNVAISLGDLLRRTSDGVARGAILRDRSLQVPGMLATCMFVNGVEFPLGSVDDFMLDDLEMVELEPVRRGVVCVRITRRR